VKRRAPAKLGAMVCTVYLSLLLEEGGGGRTMVCTAFAAFAMFVNV
jgi:hypothetical protein